MRNEMPELTVNPFNSYCSKGHFPYLFYDENVGYSNGQTVKLFINVNAAERSNKNILSDYRPLYKLQPVIQSQFMKRSVITLHLP